MSTLDRGGRTQLKKCFPHYLRWPGAMCQVAASELKPFSLWMIWEKGEGCLCQFPMVQMGMEKEQG